MHGSVESSSQLAPNVTVGAKQFRYTEVSFQPGYRCNMKCVVCIRKELCNMSCCHVARPCSNGSISARRKDRRRCPSSCCVSHSSSYTITSVEQHTVALDRLPRFLNGFAQFVLFGRWFMDAGGFLTQASYVHVPVRKHPHHLVIRATTERLHLRASGLQTFFASCGFAFFDDRAEHFQRCSFQCARRMLPGCHRCLCISS